MASELRVNTLKDAAGNNSVGMSYVAEGTARHWVNFNQTGTQAIRESFNAASLTDGGTGISTVNFTTSLANADYAVQNTKGSEGYRGFHSVKSLATGSYGVDSRNDGGNEADSIFQIGTVHGDLA